MIFKDGDYQKMERAALAAMGPLPDCAVPTMIGHDCYEVPADFDPHDYLARWLGSSNHTQGQ